MKRFGTLFFFIILLIFNSMSTGMSFTVEQVSQKMEGHARQSESGGATTCDYLMFAAMIE